MQVYVKCRYTLEVPKRFYYAKIMIFIEKILFPRFFLPKIPIRSATMKIYPILCESGKVYYAVIF